MNQKVTVLRLDTGLPFILDAQLISNGDGSVSFQLPNGTFAGQSPDGGYGVRADGPAAQQYQRALLSGSTVTFLPHPEWPAYSYFVGTGKVFPA